MNKVLKVLAIVILTLLLLLGIIIYGIQTPFGQNLLTTQINTFLRKKLRSDVNIEKIRFDIPDWIVLEGVFFADMKGDTLLSGQKIRIDLDMYRLIQGDIGINTVEVAGLTANIYRTLPDTTFNFQFIVDAFAGEPTAPDTAASEPLNMRLDKIILKNIQLSYRDAVIGTDAKTHIDSAYVGFDAFNPTTSTYHPTHLFLRNSEASLRLYEALAQPEAAAPAAPSDPADSLNINLGDIDIQKFKWSFIDETSGINNGVNIGRLKGHVNKVYVAGQYVDLKEVALEDMTAFVELEKRLAKAPVKDTIPAQAPTPGWTAKVGNLTLANNGLRYDDFNQPAQAKGMDYNHINITNLHIQLNDFIFSDANIAGQLKSAKFRDKSGFKIESFRTNFAYGVKQTYLKNLLLTTGNTTLRDEMILKYKNIDELTTDPSKVQVSLNLKDSKVGFGDILYLVPDLVESPPFDKNPNGSLSATARVEGTVDNLQIAKANFKLNDGTILDLNGRIQGLPDTDKLGLNLSLNQFSTTKADLLQLLPDSTLPASIELPDSLALTGAIAGDMSNMNLSTNIVSTYGNGTFTGNLKNITDSIRAEYDGELAFQDFDLGKLLKQPPQEMGKLTLNTQVVGTGYALSSMRADLTGTVQSASIKGYTYNNLTLQGGINQGKAQLDAQIKDTNIDLQVNGQADISQEYPTAAATVNVDNLDLTALNLYADSLAIKGNIKIDFQSTNPDNPKGTIDVANLVLTHRGRPIGLDSMHVAMLDSASLKKVIVQSPILKLDLQGNYQYETLADAVFTEVGKHLKVPELAYTEIQEPTDFTLNATLTNHPAIQIFVPELQEMNTIKLEAKLNNQIDSSLIATLSAPLVSYDSLRTEGMNLKFYSESQQAGLQTTLKQLSTGGFRMQNASLEADIADNNLVYDFTVRDSVQKDRHSLKGKIAIAGSHYSLSFRDGLLLDYQPWQAPSEGTIEYAPDSLWVRNIAFLRNQQALRINSTDSLPNSPLAITMDQIALGPLVTAVTQDSTLMGGTLNGDLELKNYLTTPLFTGTFDIEKLAVMQIPLGKLQVKADNERENDIAIALSLKGEGNDANLDGHYNIKEEQALNFTLDLKSFSGKTVEAFSFGELQRASGSLSGKTTITGSTDNPRLNGALHFNEFAFNVTQLGSRYRLADQNIQFKDQNILFNNFILKDSLDQALRVNGNVSIATLPDVGYDLKVDTKNFVALNSTQKDNEMFYGKALINADLRVKGKGSNSVIDGDVKINSGSNITFVMTDDVTEAGDARVGVIEFVDMSDSTQKAQTQKVETNKAITTDFATEITVDLDVDDKSQFTVVLDELNGDNIKLKGNAQLTAGVAPNGQVYLLGAYDVTEGTYDITLEILKRKFDIVKGSNLIWSGDPMKADLNITAAYTVMVDPGSISTNLVGGRKVPIDVQIIITGNLTNPNITFQVVPSKDVSTDLAKEITNQPFWLNMSNSPSEVNKQAFALLITNRFITDQSSKGVNINSSAEAIARQSVSQLLSDQLNNLAGDLVKGVDVDLDLNSTTDQTAGARTDLNVGVSKAFLNDRLKISVGKNFELENQNGSSGSSEVFDNIALDYSLSRDGRYLFRAFRKNQYQSILEGFIIETGVSFIVTADYDLLQEFFKRQQDEK
ncbi:autotransporter translocation and assembly factor TamB [Dyadobacter jejuensis]|uniref:Autotransporter translocation and assembly factor TamB n=1 Tax=Dyadobacter jejuensis TaxID=1082580 RepID=A0A316AQ85_9BACT|nr:translocation/assembly module TamB [Dyadobacter jejuensis]PWJ59586.1 autotransporter translocation and assembly factor TamB [Dyadobacter jejuensis]